MLLTLVHVLLDLGAVLEPVTGDSVSEHNWVVENLSPVQNSIDVVIHPCASIERFWESPEDSTDVLESRNGMEVSKVIESGNSLVDEWLVDLHAVLKLVEVVVSSQTEDETSSELWDGIDGREPDVWG